jgi:hypothetical protein
MKTISIESLASMGVWFVYSNFQVARTPVEDSFLHGLKNKPMSIPLLIEG